MAHRRLVEAGRPLPVDVKDAAIFHAGPIIRPLENDKFEMVSVGPLIVSIDAEGRNRFEENKVIFNERKEKAIEEICKHVGFIK